MYPNQIILSPDEEVEFLALPQKHLAGFECEYCRNVYVVDLLNQAIKCPGCNHGAPYEAVMLALNPIHKRSERQGRTLHRPLPNLPGSGSYPHPDDLRYSIVTGSHSYPEPNRYDQIANTIRLSQSLQVPPPFYPDSIGFWKGEQITKKNLERVHQEMVEYDIDPNIISSVLSRRYD